MEPILLLHGAISSSKQMLPLQEELQKQFSSVHVFDFPGHGGKAFPAEAFSMKLFAESVLKWMDENQFKKINIFGYSMGGFVGLYLAKYFPERVGKIITLGTKLEWDHFIAADMARMIDAEKIALKAPVLAEALDKLHQPNHWKEVLHRTTELFLNLGSEPALTLPDFEEIKHDILLMLGDQDRMVTIEETNDAQKHLKNSTVEIIPGTPHPIEQANLEQLAKITGNFFQ
ncbi:MAG: alpha/beta hydrolase [Bacteroidota bacterium]|nr:alpha/beta hydrolase [Bacteroidota bacterium]